MGWGVLPVRGEIGVEWELLAVGLSVGVGVCEVWVGSGGCIVSCRKRMGVAWGNLGDGGVLVAGGVVGV